MIKLELPSERNSTKSDYLYASSISKLLSIIVVYMYMCEVAGFNSLPKMRYVPSDTMQAISISSPANARKKRTTVHNQFGYH